MLRRLGYENSYAFSSKVLREIAPTHLRLDTVYRQTDPAFVDLLTRLRSGRTRRDAVEELNAACLEPHRSDATPLILTPTNAAADYYNQTSIEALPEGGRGYTGAVAGEFGGGADRFPAPMELDLKIGARVRALKNGPDLAWVNGSLGEVVGLEAARVDVLFDHLPDPSFMEAEKWERVT
jgi:hypothetical protein